MTGPAPTVRALIPVKPLPVCKQRLAAALGDDERQALALWMLHHLLHVLAASPGVRPLILSDDATVRGLCQRHSTEWARDPGVDLNDTLDRAAASSFAQGWPAVLFLPADLPLVTGAEVAALLACHAAGAQVVLAPAMRDGGTNALLFGAGSGFHFQMGPASFARHARQVEHLGLHSETFEPPGLAFDLDTPDDLARVALPPSLLEWYCLQRSRAQFDPMLSSRMPDSVILERSEESVPGRARSRSLLQGDAAGVEATIPSPSGREPARR